MLQFVNNLSIRVKISGFVIPSTIAFGFVMTCLSLYFLHDYKAEMLASFNDVLTTIQHQNATIVSETQTEKLIGELSTKADEKIESIQLILISTVLTVIALATVGAIIISGMIGKPIQTVADRLENISSGDADLTKRLPDHSKDETGKVARYFNAFLDKLQQLISQLQVDADKLNSSAQSIHGELKTIEEKVESTKDLSQTVYRSAGYMNSDMIEISTILKESADGISIITSAVNELTDAATEISQTSVKAHQNTENTKAKMDLLRNEVHELEKAGNDISKVTETISDISDQVNLLSLNATIEAARAGDAGKGFAVVANEIKELAHQTSRSATEIQNRIDQVQLVTQTTIAGINDATEFVSQNTTVVSTIASAVEQQTATVSEIASSLETASEKLDYSNEKVSKAASYAGEMAEMSNTVSDAAVEVEEAVAIIKSTSMLLKDLSENSTKTTRQFRT